MSLRAPPLRPAPRAPHLFEGEGKSYCESPRGSNGKTKGYDVVRQQRGCILCVTPTKNAHLRDRLGVVLSGKVSVHFAPHFVASWVTRFPEITDVLGPGSVINARLADPSIPTEAMFVVPLEDAVVIFDSEQQEDAHRECILRVAAQLPIPEFETWVEYGFDPNVPRMPPCAAFLIGEVFARTPREQGKVAALVRIEHEGRISFLMPTAGTLFWFHIEVEELETVEFREDTKTVQFIFHSKSSDGPMLPSPRLSLCCLPNVDHAPTFCMILQHMIDMHASGRLGDLPRRAKYEFDGAQRPMKWMGEAVAVPLEVGPADAPRPVFTFDVLPEGFWENPETTNHLWYFPENLGVLYSRGVPRVGAFMVHVLYGSLRVDWAPRKSVRVRSESVPDLGETASTAFLPRRAWNQKGYRLCAGMNAFVPATHHVWSESECTYVLFDTCVPNWMQVAAGLQKLRTRAAAQID